MAVELKESSNACNGIPFLKLDHCCVNIFLLVLLPAAAAAAAAAAAQVLLEEYLLEVYSV